MIPLSNVALALRNSDTFKNFDDISLIEILEKYFNVGTENQNLIWLTQGYVHWNICR